MRSIGCGAGGGGGWEARGARNVSEANKNASAFYHRNPTKHIKRTAEKRFEELYLHLHFATVTDHRFKINYLRLGIFILLCYFIRMIHKV